MRGYQVTSTLTLALVLATGAASAQDFERPTPKEGFSYPEYYCTNRGIRVEVEEESCLIIGEKMVTAVCDISLNNPMWRITDEECTPIPEVLEAAGMK